jgi:hypothetical protein
MRCNDGVDGETCGKLILPLPFCLSIIALHASFRLLVLTFSHLAGGINLFDVYTLNPSSSPGSQVPASGGDAAAAVAEGR